MIDLHSHILPGLDDGARTIADSREIARRAAADGVTAIAATPHVRTDYPTRPEEMETRVEELRRDFRDQDIAVDVLHGGEIALDMLHSLAPADLKRFTLAQSGRYLLIEFPYSGWPYRLDETVFELGVAGGFSAILAHPERNAEVQAKPERLAEAVRVGALLQVTAASLDGRVGGSAKAAGQRLLELGLVHLLASDSHTAAIREAGLAGAVAALGDEELARYLTVEAPRAVVAGDDVPAPRRLARRRRLVPRLSRRR